MQVPVAGETPSVAQAETSGEIIAEQSHSLTRIQAKGPLPTASMGSRSRHAVVKRSAPAD